MSYKEFSENRIKKQILLSVVLALVLAAGWRYPVFGGFIVICMFGGIVISIFRGRKWCDWYCPRGSFLDYAGKKISPGKNIPGIYKNIWFRMGIVFVMMGLIFIQISGRWPDPYEIGLFLVTMLTVTTILSLIFSAVHHQRSWCYICPVGTISNCVGRGKNTVKIDSESCNLCGACSAVCPVQIVPHSFRGQGIREITDPDCIKCGLCSEVCPQNALSQPGKSPVSLKGE